MISLNKSVTSKKFLLNRIDSRLLPDTMEEFKTITNSNSSKLRLLGLDIGKLKCGIAISDDLQDVAMPLKIVATKLLDPYLKFINENIGIIGLVVGLPLTPTGNLGVSSSNICSVLNGLSDFINRSNTFIWLHDERFTTVSSYSDLRYYQKSELVDDLCAMKILQEHLDLRNLRSTQQDRTRANAK